MGFPWIKSKFWLPSLLLAILININVLTNGFVWDDVILIEQQIPGFQTLSDVIFPDLTIFQISKNYYRPLITLSFLWDQKIWNQNPFGYHLTVFLFHIGNTLLVFFLSRRLLRDHANQNWIALLTSSLFAVHPIHTESVAWMSGRTDSISAFFMFSSMLCYVKYHEKEKNGIGLLIFSSIFFFLALCGKEVAISLLLLFPLFNLLKRKQAHSAGKTFPKPGLKTFMFPFLALLAYYAMRQGALGEPLGKMQWEMPTDKNVFMDLILISGFYLKKLLWPYPLQAFIPDIPSTSFHLWVSVLLLLLFSFVLMVAILKNYFITGFSLAWTFFSLAPSLLVAFSSVSKTPIAERYLYIPSFGICLLAGFLLIGLFQSSYFKRQLSQAKQVFGLTLILGLIFLPWTWTTFHRNQVWNNNISFWTDLVQKIPEYGLPRNNLGHAYISAGRFTEAEKELKLALQLKDKEFGKSLASSSLGNIYRLKGEGSKAKTFLLNALRLNPSNHHAFFYLGNLYFDRAEKAGAKNQKKREWLEQAANYLEEAIAINPIFPEGHYDLGLVQRQLGNPKEARSHFEKVITLSVDPTSAQVQNAKMLLGKGKVTVP